MSVNQVFLHQHPDLDACAAFVIARIAGTENFPGIEQAQVSFHGKLPISLEEMVQQEAIALDFGWQVLSEDEKQDPRVDAHIFDHHNRFDDTSTTMMIANQLGITYDKIWKSLVDYVNMHDVDGSSACTQALNAAGIILPREIYYMLQLLEKFSLANVISILAKDDKQTLQLIKKFITQYYEKQQRFFTEVAQEYAEKAEKKTIRILDEEGHKYVKLAVIESDMDGVASFAFTRESGINDMVIQRFSSGNTIILANQRTKPIINLKDTSHIIQVLEMKRRHIFETYKFSQLGTGEMISLCPQWFIAKNRMGIIWGLLNGSRKHDIEATKLSLEDIMWALGIGINPQILDKSCPRTNCLGPSCGYYPFGLERCGRIREKTNNSN